MKNLLMLLLVTVLPNLSYAQNFQDVNVQEHYFQILLKKWLESEDWQELRGRPGSILDFRELTRVIDSMAKKHYNVGLREIRHLSPGRYDAISIDRGEQNEYQLVRVRELPGREQIWFLVSSVNMKVLSTYKDKILAEVEKTPAEREAQNIYAYLLEESNANRCVPLWNLQPSNTPSGDESDIDSVTVVSIAVEATERYYGVEKMTPLAAMLMGGSNEHWLVYSFQTLQDDFYQQVCISNLIHQYENGTLRTNVRGRCPAPVGVLISKKDGRVLFIKTIR
ncbi:MAG: hypothetical protein LBD23_19130 [Oscillospiraceae bacterium]|jgi:hypothetical protein|nr:hypothetical protein [Oscillospiraceae bacterium]